MNSVWSKARELESAGVSFVMVTLVQTRGHAPQDPGAKAVVTREGLCAGTVGGGKVEARCIARSQELLAQRAEHAQSGPSTELVTWNLQRDIGMTCGGEVTYLFEVITPSGWRVVIFGAGHVAQSLVRGLELLDCRVICVDHRDEWIQKLPVNERLERVCIEKPALWLEQARGDDFFVVMTQGHSTDVPILEAIFLKCPDAAYIGVIGSDVKAIIIRSELKARGLADSLIAKLHCPIGLPLGGNHPGEIAVSVLAQLIQVRDSRTQASLTTDFSRGNG